MEKKYNSMKTKLKKTLTFNYIVQNNLYKI